MSLPYVHSYTDARGKLRRYFRKRGYPQIALSGRPGSPEFQMAYNAALAGLRAEQTRPRTLPSPGSTSAAIAAYYVDNSFVSLASSTRDLYRGQIERFRRDFGDLRFAQLTQERLARILGKLRPYPARNMLKSIRALMQFAKKIGLRPDDPTQGIEPAKIKTSGIHTWTEDEIAIFESHHAIGTKARLAMAILLYTAARRSDAIKLGRPNIRAGRICYRQQKTRRALEIPIHPTLAAIIETTPSGHLAFLVTARGKPFTPQAFGKLFRQWCNEAGLRHCSAHGLRKAQARRLAEAGCSAHEIAAITGHQTLKEVQRYADAANQVTLAEMAFKRTRS